MPMIPMGAAPEDEMMGMGAPAPPVPAPPGMAGPMMDGPEPAPEEVAMMLGAQLEEQRAVGHMMVDAEADARMQGVMAMIAQAGDAAQVMGPGQIA